MFPVLLVAAVVLPLDIVREAVELSEKADRLRTTYSHTLEDISRSGDEVKSKTFEVTHRDGKQYRKLIRRNGKPVDAQPEQPYSSKNDDRKREMFREFSKALDFTMGSDETMDGHDCWVIFAKPKPGYKPPSFHAAFLAQMEGKVWIAKKSNRMVKLDAITVGPVSFGGFLAKLGAGTKIHVEQKQLDGEVWLPTRFRLTYNGRLLFKSFEGEMEQFYTNYQRISPAT